MDMVVCCSICKPGIVLAAPLWALGAFASLGLKAFNRNSGSSALHWRELPYTCSLALQRQIGSFQSGSALHHTCPLSPCFCFWGQWNKSQFHLSWMQCICRSDLLLYWTFSQWSPSSVWLRMAFCIDVFSLSPVLLCVLPVLSLSSGHVNNWGQDLGYSTFQGKGSVFPLFKN